MTRLSLSLRVNSVRFEIPIVKTDVTRMLCRCVGYSFSPFVLGNLTDMMRALDHPPHKIRTARAVPIQTKMINMLTALNLSFCLL